MINSPFEIATRLTTTNTTPCESLSASQRRRCHVKVPVGRQGSASTTARKTGKSLVGFIGDFVSPGYWRPAPPLKQCAGSAAKRRPNLEALDAQAKSTWDCGRSIDRPSLGAQAVAGSVCILLAQDASWDWLSTSIRKRPGATAYRRFNQVQRSVKMVGSISGIWRRTVAILVSAGLLVLSGAAHGTNQSQQRQAGRNANQNAKHEARSNKADCRAANQKSNSQCRQDKRHTKQGGRQEKRDIKY